MIAAIMFVIKWSLLILIAKKADKVLDNLGRGVLAKARLSQSSRPV
jgi:hypothetical protein